MANVLMTTRDCCRISAYRSMSGLTLLPGKVGDSGRSRADNRLFVEAVLWIVRVGAPWRNLPEDFGQGNRVKGSAGIDEACEEIVVPGGDLAPHAQRVFAGCFADQVVSHMFDGCE